MPQASRNSSTDEVLSASQPCWVRWALATPGMPGHASTLGCTPPGLRGRVGNPAAGDVRCLYFTFLADTMTQDARRLFHIPFVYRTAGPFGHT
jgi:hypothetical protein